MVVPVGTPSVRGLSFDKIPTFDKIPRFDKSERFCKISIFANCQARVQVPNPVSQQAPNPDSKVRPSLKNPKTKFFGLG